MWTMTAVLLLAVHVPETAKRPVEIGALVDRARGVPAEFTADALLRLADSKAVRGSEWKKELIEEAFAAAARAQHRTERIGEYLTDSRYGPAALGVGTGLDTISLQARAVSAM